MVKVIRIPETLDMSYNSSIWDLLCSNAFSRLRCGLSDKISDEGLAVLRKGFAPFCVLTNNPLSGEKYVDEDKEITIDMMERASYKLTKLEVSR